MLSCEIMLIDLPPGCTIQDCINDFTVNLSSKCTECGCTLIQKFTFASHPLLLAIEFSQTIHSFDHILNIHVDGLAVHYQLKGVIYFTGDHFTAHFITQAGLVWYHNRIFTGCMLVYESQDPTSMPTQDAISIIYTCENSDMPYIVVAASSSHMTI
jgi:hypothetical protein